MANTYYLYNTYGKLTPTFGGQTDFLPCRYNLSPVITQANTNQVFAKDATSDYSTFSTTGITGFFDYQKGTYGLGSARYILDGSSPTPLVKIPGSDYYNTGADTYKTASVRVWSEHALSFRLDLNLKDNGGTAVGGTDSSAVVTVNPREWTDIRVTSTVNGYQFLATLNVLNFSSSTDTGKIFYLDAVQVENNRYPTGYIGQVQRLATSLSYSISKTAPDWTALCWAVAGPQTSSAAGGTLPFFTLYYGSTTYATLSYQRGTTKVQAFKDDTDPNTDINISDVVVNPGDVLFGALVHDGLTLTAYFGKMGDSSLQSASGSTDFDYFNTIYLGQNPISTTYSNGAVEQFLLYNRALTSNELEGIFSSTSPLDYTSDKRIIFSAATPSTVGSIDGLSVTSTGFLRNRDLTASLDIISTTNLNASASDVQSSTHIVYGADVKILEVGDVLSSGTNLTTSSLYKVDRINFNTTGTVHSAYVTKQ